MADQREPEVIESPSVPQQPEAQASKRFNLKVVGGIGAVILVLGIANLHTATTVAQRPMVRDRL